MNDDEPLTPTSWSWVPCTIARKQEGGLYNSVLQTLAGYATELDSLH